MHSKAELLGVVACGDQVGRLGLVLGDVGREVHLLPLVVFHVVVDSGEPELSEVQVADEIDVSVTRLFVDVHGVVVIDPESILLNIQGNVLEDELILIASEPSPVPVEAGDVLQ